MRYFLELSYNGADYHGWQIQPNARTVQEVVEKTISTLLKHNIAIVGAGRTDAGVHALQMFAHFDTVVNFNDSDLIFKLNSFLPKDIVIHNIIKVKKDTHTRFNAISRAYIYRISLHKNAFTLDETYYLKSDLDIEKMKEATKILFEYKDFQCFSKSHTDVKTYNCKIMEANWKMTNNELQFTIRADRFLRNMVRAIVGTLLNVGFGKISIQEFHDIIKSKNRSEAGFSVPAHALYLYEIKYPDTINYNG